MILIKLSNEEKSILNNLRKEEIWKIIDLNNYCTKFMFLVTMVFITLLSNHIVLHIFQFPLVFKISLLFVEVYIYRF